MTTQVCLYNPLEQEGGKNNELKSLCEYDMNFNVCNLCAKDAEKTIVCCSSCPRSFHEACGKLTTVPTGKWNCPVCVLSEENCIICGLKLDYSRDKCKVQCISCLCSMHFDCVEVEEKLLFRMPKYWKGTVEKGSVAPYICYDCQKGCGPEVILDSYNLEEVAGYAQAANNYYLVKFKHNSFGNAVWVRGQDLKTYASPNLISNFEMKVSESDTLNLSEMLDGNVNYYGVKEDYLEIEKITNKWVPNLNELDITEPRYLVKWRGLQYKYSTWERESDLIAYRDKIERYEQLRLLETQIKGGEVTPETLLTTKPLLHFTKFTIQPDFVRQGKLLDYQLEGVNWLIESWSKNNNAVVVGDSGLGKTIECLTFLQYLYMKGYDKGPFMICTTMTSLDNWCKECGIWFPEANVVNYVGKHISREYAQMKEMYFTKGVCKFTIMITYYDVISKAKKEFQEVNWSIVVIDDANKLRTRQAKLFQEFNSFKIKYKLLMVNTLTRYIVNELIPALQFLFPNKTIAELLSIGKNDTMRVLKVSREEAFTDLKTKKEIIVRVEMTSKQKEVYKDVLVRNYKALKQTTKGFAIVKAFMNVLNLLQLCSDSALLLTKEFNDRIMDEDAFENLTKKETYLDDLIGYSGKLKLLDLLLSQLQASNKRVLIYIHWKAMLEVIEKYLKPKGYRWIKITTAISQAERRKLIITFNEDTSYSILLASTKGMWINVEGIDAVVVFDSNFYTSCDIQMLRQCLMKDVIIYRLVSKDTVEEKIVDLTKHRTSLKDSLIKNDKIGITLIDKILKHGTSILFGYFNTSEDVKYSETTIKSLLDKEAFIGEDKDQYDYYLSKFTTSLIPTEEIIENEMSQVNHWQKLLKSRQIKNKVLVFNHAERSAVQNYFTAPEVFVTPSEANKASHIKNLVQIESVAQYLINSNLAALSVIMKHGTLAFKGRDQSFASSYGVDLLNPLDPKTSVSLILWNFNAVNRHDFIEILMKYGVHNNDWKDLYNKCFEASRNSLRKKTFDEFMLYAQKFSEDLNHLLKNKKYEQATIFTEQYSAKQIVTRVSDIVILKELYRRHVNSPANFNLGSRSNFIILN